MVRIQHLASEVAADEGEVSLGGASTVFVSCRVLRREPPPWRAFFDGRQQPNMCAWSLGFRIGG